MEPVIFAEGLTKFYGAQRGIEDLDLSVGPGEIFGYLGPNGSGKTTTIRLMLGFVRPTRGLLRIFGRRPRRSRTSEHERIGYLPGEFGLYDNARGENVLDLYARLSHSRAPMRDWVCEALRFPLSERRRRIKTYSKGMKQKLAIVQTLQHDPDLIILDEPTTGLDPVVQSCFFDVLIELKRRGKTVFLSSHILPEVYRLCDRLATLMEGRLVLTSSVPDLISSAPRLLWLKRPSDETPRLAAVPMLPRATFVRREGDWYIYQVEPGEVASIIAELETLAPSDFLFESALETSFLRLYEHKTSEAGR